MDDGAESARDWLEQATFTLAAADDLTIAGLFEQVISNAFLAMLYAARAALAEAEVQAGEWRDVVQAFQSRDLSGFGMSNAGRRCLPIVAQLYASIVEERKAEADPETAAACLRDAREFVDELEEIIDGAGA
jgi:uncharacterized protein (UPF0332 family)